MSAFTDNGITASMEAELIDWGNQLATESGGVVALNIGDLINVGRNGVRSFAEFSRWIWDNYLPQVAWGSVDVAKLKAEQPWLGLGVTSDPDGARANWHKMVNDFGEQWYSLTGSTLNMSNADDLDRVMQAARQGETAVQFAQRLKDDPNMLKAYGWLRHGLDYSSFQQTKRDMHTSFGRDLSDQEALAILDQQHQGSTGGNVAVRQTDSATGKEAGFVDIRVR